MNTVFKILSLVLSYPTDEIHAGMREIAAAAGECALGKAEKELLQRLAYDIAKRDRYDAQERYVFLFDRTRSLSLHLFEHVHGESRDRGQAMVDLMTMYETDGFAVDAKELPDYLPMFLEYLSMKPEAEARELLGQTAHILAALRERLKRRSSVYANAFAVLEALAAGKPDAGLLSDLLKAAEDDPDDLKALDRVWEEEAVTFGGNAGEGACGPDRLGRQIRAASRKPADPAQPPTA